MVTSLLLKKHRHSMLVIVCRYYDFVGIGSTFGYLCWMNYIQSLWKLVSDQKTRQYQIILTAKDEILFHSTSTIFSSLITLVVCKWWLDRLRFRQFPNHSNEQINNFSIMSLFKWKSCFVVIAIAKMKSQHSLPVKKICQNFKMFLFFFFANHCLNISDVKPRKSGSTSLTEYVK